MTYLSTTERAAIIRKDIKAKLGATTRDVSVRRHHGSIDVEIKNAAVRKADVEAIAMAHESISRDDASGEILCGGNTFVRVEYTDEALAPIEAEIRAALDAGESWGDMSIADVSRDGAGWDMWRIDGAELYGVERMLVCSGRDYAIRKMAELAANQPRAEKAVA